MAKITEKQMEVLINCIGAVETGGMIYGKRRYDDYTNSYTNSSAEDSITIGAFQEFRGNARDLLRDIQTEYPTIFKKYDNAGIADDIKKASWSGYNPSTTSSKAAAIVKIISCDEGKKVQDERIVKLINQYIDYAESLGVINTDALFLCANFIHQGGNSACKRILGKTTKPYTLEKLYQATLTDTGNQVGAYKTRQKFMYDNIKKHLNELGATNQDVKTQNNGGNDMSVKDIIEKATVQMETWAKDDSHGYDQIYRWGEKGDYDCSAAVIQAWQNAGVPVKTQGASYTGDMLPAFKKCGFQDITSQVNKSSGSGLVRGDVLLNTDRHTAMYIGNGQEVEASINEKGTATGGKPGDQTGREFLIRSYRNYPWTNILRYTGGATVTPTTSSSSVLKLGSIGDLVKTLQKNLNTLMKAGLDVDGSFGNATYNAVIAFQKKYGLEVDGEVGKNTQAKITELLKNSTTSPTTPNTSSVTIDKGVKWNGTVTASSLNVRTWAGTNNPLCSFSPLAKGTQVGVCGTVTALDGSDWYYILYKGKYGFVSAQYIKK